MTLHGRQSPDVFYSRSAIFVMTSAFEGFPNTIVEAQSFGAVPVLFNSFPVAEFIVSDGTDGVLVQPFDIDAMASRIIAIAQSKERSELAAGALRSARRFQIDTVGEQWVELFDECIQRR
jgi:glycosyltransferase involved in cell wall biosynthesis